MKLRGEDTAGAIREWVRDEIKKGPSCILDLGKFFFTVSSSTFGLMVTIEKLAPSAGVHLSLVASLACLFLSILVALRMAIPSTHDLDGTVDIYSLYTNHTKRVTNLSIVWFVLWVVGIAIWLCRLF